MLELRAQYETMLFWLALLLFRGELEWIARGFGCGRQTP
jgi:hypothetical protein